ncbi:unnamed protein product [Euphydryas editha]|uniref:Gag-like protein n=1 Tax=Euphydryas editha TaxID=104508 RepID=A0AAU9UT09_EUPED|nr:unnamed protein product [Euphydryas editha]
MSRGYVRDRGSCLNRPDREGQTGADSNASLRVSRHVRKTGKRPRLFSALSSSSDESQKTARQRSSGRKEEGSNNLDRELEALTLEAAESRRTLPDVGLDVGDVRTVHALSQQASSDVDLIVKVATRSRNMKGTYVKALKDAAASIRVAVEALKERSTSDEVKKLQAENTCLSQELDELRSQMAKLRKDRSEWLAEDAPARILQKTEAVEKLRASVMVTVDRMLDARFASLEERLLPAQTFYPPLAADKHREAAQESQALAPACSSKKKTQPGRAPASTTAVELAIHVEATKTPADDWATVVRWKPKKKAKASAPDVVTSANQTAQPQRKKRPQKPRIETPLGPQPGQNPAQAMRRKESSAAHHQEGEGRLPEIIGGGSELKPMVAPLSHNSKQTAWSGRSRDGDNACESPTRMVSVIFPYRPGQVPPAMAPSSSNESEMSVPPISEGEMDMVLERFFHFLLKTRGSLPSTAAKHKLNDSSTFSRG